MYHPLRRAAMCVLLIILTSSALHAQPSRRIPKLEEVAAYAVQSGENTWKKSRKPEPNLTSRELFTYALALCEAKTNLDRLQPLFERGAQMQDRDTNSKTYGNFRWSWKDEGVFDLNAVKFCMQGGSLLWIRHRDTMPAGARKVLSEVLEFAVEGVLRHRVNPEYTNIALMNAENLILLGEALNKTAIADEGYKRLDAEVIYIHDNGIHEYASPTYYGVDLECLGFIETFAQRERGRVQARALLQLFWNDTAWNWFEPAQKLAGPRSRDYDYLRGLGMIDNAMWLHGWLPGKPTGGPGALYTALSNWHPDDKLWTQSLNQFPRRVRASWGIEDFQSRTHWLARDVTLGSAAANYHTMDIPLSADFPGPREDVRCYFIPDARNDPYGKSRIQESAAHAKTLHLRPFWTAVQSTSDALGLVIYRDKDIPEGSTSLQSHWVMPRNVAAIFVGDKRVALQDKTPLSIPVQAGEVVAIHKGSAAVAVRVVLARDSAGQAAKIALVDDANTYGAIRLTVDHSNAGKVLSGGFPAAAMWVRVGSNLQTDAEFQTWRKEFAAAPVKADFGADKVLVSAPNSGLTIEAKSSGNVIRLEPAPSRATLELDGVDVGRQLLSQVEPVKSRAIRHATVPLINIAPDRDVYFEAESGAVDEPMQIDSAAADRWVWMPGIPGERGGSSGAVSYRLNVTRASKYFVWARVQTPTPDDDSFFVRVATAGGKTLVPATTWAVGVHPKWQWIRVSFDETTRPNALELPAGEASLQLRTREDGAKIDRLFITTNPAAAPR